MERSLTKSCFLLSSMRWASDLDENTGEPFRLANRFSRCIENIVVPKMCATKHSAQVEVISVCQARPKLAIGQCAKFTRDLSKISSLRKIICHLILIQCLPNYSNDIPRMIKCAKMNGEKCSPTIKIDF